MKLRPLWQVRCGVDATWKWLAMVAAERYARETALVGQLRQREAQGSAQSGAAILPSYISTSPDNDSFHHPFDLVFSGPGALSAGSEVWVTLDDSVPLEGASAAPSLTRWSAIAFMRNRPARQVKPLALWRGEAAVRAN